MLICMPTARRESRHLKFESAYIGSYRLNSKSALVRIAGCLGTTRSLAESAARSGGKRVDSGIRQTKKDFQYDEEGCYAYSTTKKGPHQK